MSHTGGKTNKKNRKPSKAPQPAPATATTPARAREAFSFQCKEQNIRLDRLLKIEFGIGHALACKHLRKGNILANGKKASDNSLRIQAGDEILLKAPLISEIESIKNKAPEGKKRPEAKPTQEAIRRIQECILFQNDQIIVINKPAGLATQSGTSVSFGLDSIMKQAHKGALVTHRLDKETSGIIVFAKNREAAQKITNLFKRGEIKKTYLAVVWGRPEKTKGRIDMPIKDQGKEQTERPKQAETHYEVLQTNGEMSLLRLKPSTGRKHQLRIHSAQYLNTPIVGDTKYGPKRQSQTGPAQTQGKKDKTKDQMQLCSYKIEFPKEAELGLTKIQLPSVPSFFSIQP